MSGARRGFYGGSIGCQFQPGMKSFECERLAPLAFASVAYQERPHSDGECSLGDRCGSALPDLNQSKSRNPRISPSA